VLVIAASPMLVSGVMVFVQHPSDWLECALVVGMGIWLIGLNATLRLVLTGGEVALKRWGLTVWRVPIKGTQLIEGRGGRPPILPAYVLRRGTTEVGYILKVWFDDKTIAELRRSLKR
jgi:hypothetical protein